VVVTQHGSTVAGRGLFVRFVLWLVNDLVGAWVRKSADRLTSVREIANGVDARIYFPRTETERAALRDSFGLRTGDQVILFVGRFVEAKGLPHLREWAAALPNHVWWFAGWGPIDPDSWALPHLKTWRGLSGESLARVYAAADLLVLPSEVEGGSPALVIQEAMACGTPALTTPQVARGCPPASDLIWEEPIGAGWISRIEALLASGTATRARNSVAERAHALWSWERTTEAYVRIYSDLIH
jgi:glycosyltransferase involved in cell wall biosynthesis